MTALKLKPYKVRPLEREEQATYFNWLKYKRHKGRRIPGFAIPNGSFFAGSPAQRAIQGNALRRQGVSAGVPDTFIAIPANLYCGMFIEFKRIGAPKPSEDQAKWHAELRMWGYCVFTAYGFEQAKAFTEEYLR